MPRYFIEVSYKGTAYSGFQVQKNGITIQSEVEKALQIYFKKPFSLTGSSRTDAGVHALQNFFLDRYAEAYRTEMDHFAAVIEGSEPLVGFHDGIAALKLAEAAAKSHSTNRLVAIPS